MNSETVPQLIAQEKVAPFLLLGVGNILYGDEGVGVHLIQSMLQRYTFPADLEVLDGGALGWNLIRLLQGRQAIVIVDAVAAEVGAVYRFTHQDVPQEVHYGKLSSHEWEIPELLFSMELYGDLPPTVIVAMGVDPLETLTRQLNVGLSHAVEARVAALEKVVLRELAALGLQLDPISEN